MTDEQIRDWRLEQAGSVPRNGKSEREWTNAIAIEYARLVADNAMPVEDEYSAFQSEIEPGRWYVGKGRVAILATEIGASGEREAREVAALLNGDKRTAALQAELDRANSFLDRIANEAESFNAPIAMQTRIRNVLAERKSSPDAPQPAVVITDEHRQAYRRLRDHMGYPGAANDRKFIDALFAEPSS